MSGGRRRPWAEQGSIADSVKDKATNWLIAKNRTEYDEDYRSMEKWARQGFTSDFEEGDEA